MFGDLNPHLTHGSLSHPGHTPKRYLDWFNGFCVWPTHRHTDLVMCRFCDVAQEGEWPVAFIQPRRL